jgi:hypothetical protein
MTMPILLQLTMLRPPLQPPPMQPPPIPPLLPLTLPLLVPKTPLLFQPHLYDL